jgi:hypothetical protein
MGTLSIVLLFTVYLSVWGLLSLYIRRADRNVAPPRYEPQRSVYTFTDGRQITAEQLHDVVIRMTASTKQFTDGMKRVQQSIAAAAPSARRFADLMNQLPTE